MPHFEAATQRQPDHFWAQCLLAICHLQTDQPAKARIGFNACLQRKPDRVWLYLLRGFASAGKGSDSPGIAPAGQAAWLAAIASEQFEVAEADYRKALELLGDADRDADLHYALLVNRGHDSV